jgi:hypothetical protein
MPAQMEHQSKTESTEPVLYAPSTIAQNATLKELKMFQHAILVLMDSLCIMDNAQMETAQEVLNLKEVAGIHALLLKLIKVVAQINVILHHRILTSLQDQKEESL